MDFMPAVWKETHRGDGVILKFRVDRVREFHFEFTKRGSVVQILA